MQQQPQPTSLSYTETEPAAAGGTLVRAARALASRFMHGAADPVEQPFRDSDFEAESDFFGRPLGEH